MSEQGEQGGDGQGGYGQGGYGQQPPPWGAPGGPPGYGWAGPQPPQHPEGTTVLVLGILALAGGVMTGLLLVIGPFAWVKGRTVLREIDAAPGSFSGRDTVQIGTVLGIAATILLALGVLLFFLVVVVFGSLFFFSV